MRFSQGFSHRREPAAGNSELHPRCITVRPLTIVAFYSLQRLQLRSDPHFALFAVNFLFRCISNMQKLLFERGGNLPSPRRLPNGPASGRVLD